jgi:hypothetical protein
MVRVTRTTARETVIGPIFKSGSSDLNHGKGAISNTGLNNGSCDTNHGNIGSGDLNHGKGAISNTGLNNGSCDTNHGKGSDF